MRGGRYQLLTSKLCLTKYFNIWSSEKLFGKSLNAPPFFMALLWSAFFSPTPSHPRVCELQKISSLPISSKLFHICAPHGFCLSIFCGCPSFCMIRSLLWFIFIEVHFLNILDEHKDFHQIYIGLKGCRSYGSCCCLESNHLILITGWDFYLRCRGFGPCECSRVCMD